MSVPASTTVEAGTAGVDPAQHGIRAHSDGAAAFVPVQTRSERFSSYDVDRFEAVSGREPEWKFSPVSRLTTLLDGDLDGSHWHIDASGDPAITTEWVTRTDARVGSAGIPEDRASANAWSGFTDALAITVAGEEQSSATIRRSSLDRTARSAHTVITAKHHSHGHVVLANTGPAHLAENVEIVVEDGANLTVVSLQEWDDDAVHLASHFIKLGRNARLRHVIVSLGGSIVRVNPSARLVGDGSEVELFGAYFSSAGQHIEQQVFVDHVAPDTKSRVTYKGALQGAAARTVWIGDVLIRRTAVGTDSYEQNRNLMLTEGARADSIPNLEIETGDIAGAGHASASGRFDDEQLFYLQARGITEEEARRLVVRGFLAEVVQKIGSAELEARLSDAIEATLATSTTAPSPEGAR